VRGLYQQGGAFTSALFNFAVRYVADHPDLRVGFDLSAQDLQAFYLASPEWEFDVDRDDFRGAEPFIRYHLEREIALQAWGEDGQFQQGRDDDLQLQRALELLRGVGSTEALLERAGSPEGGGA
jgi:hypothetical protein